MRISVEDTGAPVVVAGAARPIPALTGVRIFLALYVVWFHFGREASARWPTVLRNFVGAGYVSVSMFFLLSGYVLAYNYLGGQPLERVRFWIARIARIAPAYAAAIGITAALYAWEWCHHTAQPVSFTVISVSLTCTQAWFERLVLWNMPAWSLSCECFFYLLFPLFAGPVMGLSRVRLRWWIVICGLLSMLPPWSTIFGLRMAIR